MALEKQMELFDDGGLLQEGGSVDEESGNEVPTGSLKKEVRDDIPAQLSEGEFVMPADVVRYHGLDKMMALRDEAKAGLQRMDDMGQMGNADEAIIPDGVPFDVNDLEVEDEPMEMQVGGFVPSAQNQFGISGFQPSQFGMPAPLPAPAPTGLPQYTAPTQAFTPTMAATTVPSFQQFIQPPAGMAPEIRVYINPQTGEERQITFINNQPTVPIPDGFILKSEYTAPTTTPPPVQAPVTAPVQQDDDGPPAPPAPRTDQFGREDDPRITQVTKSEQFAKIAKDIDPRGFLEKIKDDFLGAVGKSTTSQEYQKALDELAVGVANYTSDVEEQNKLMAEIRDNLNQATRTELGMEKVPLITPEQIAEQKFLNQFSDMKAGDFDFYGDAGVGVETALVTEKAGTRVSEAAKTEYKGIGKDPLTGKDVEPYDFEMATRILEAGSPEEMLAELSKENPALPVARALADLRAQASGAYTNFTDEEVDNARIVLNRFEETGRIPKEDKPVVSPRKTTFAPIDTEGVVEEETRIQQTRVARNQRIQEAAKGHEENYVNKGYSRSKAKTAGLNKAKADEAAKQQRRDRGETEENIAKTSAVTDSNGNPVRSGSDNSIVTSGPQSEAPEPSKSIVCTEMYRQTQLDDWAKAMKIWDVYQRKYLTPHHEIGYHWLFKPYVKGMQKSNVLTQFGAFLARKRTLHLKYVLTKGIAKDDIVGNVWCKIIHPLVYIAGRTKEWLKL